MNQLVSKIKSFFYRPPDFIIGEKENPYLLRWWVIPRNRWFNIYLHKFLRDDDDRALHSHPWPFASFMLRGSYIEMLPGDRAILRRAGSIAFRRASHQHRVELLRIKDGKRIPCWTLVVTGPRVQTWGFFCPKGFVPWYEFDKKGCGE